MSAKYCKLIPDVFELLSKRCPMSEDNDLPSKSEKENFENDEDTSDLDELEEVFADHLLMGKRLRKRLYAGDFSDLKELPDHPPIALTGLALEMFTKAVPNYGLDILDMDYVASASEDAHISPCAMILAMIYLERLQLKNSEYLETASPSGLFVVTMLVASKFLFENEDDMVTNQMWAEALNLDVKDLNHLEYEFLSAIDWKVFINSSDYFRYLSDVEKVVAFRQSKHRGWLSYSDIYVISEHDVFQGFWSWFVKRISKMALLWTIGYVATAFALHGSGIALQRYLKPVKYVPQNLTKDTTTNLQSVIYTNLQPVVEPTKLQTDISEVDLSFREFDPVVYKVSIFKRNYSGSCEKQYNQWPFHPFSNTKVATRLGDQQTYSSRNFSSCYLCHKDNSERNYLTPTNDTSAYDTWNDSQRNEQGISIFLRIR